MSAVIAMCRRWLIAKPYNEYHVNALDGLVDVIGRRLHRGDPDNGNIDRPEGSDSKEAGASSVVSVPDPFFCSPSSSGGSGGEVDLTVPDDGPSSPPVLSRRRGKRRNAFGAGRPDLALSRRQSKRRRRDNRRSSSSSSSPRRWSKRRRDESDFSSSSSSSQTTHSGVKRRPLFGGRIATDQSSDELSAVFAFGSDDGDSAPDPEDGGHSGDGNDEVLA
jgi:hypothetical protein